MSPTKITHFLFTIYKKNVKPSKNDRLWNKINKINKINDAVEMLDKKKAYCWLEKLNDVNFDIMCINKIFNAEIETLKNKENDAKNVIKDIENQY